MLYLPNPSRGEFIKSAQNFKDLLRLRNEHRILQTLQNCQNIIQCLDYYEIGEQGKLVIPYCDGLTLDRHREIPFEGKIKIIRDIAVALQQCHERNIVHGDIKEENIMIVPPKYGGWSAILIDFDLAYDVQESSNVSGTYYYMPPEMFLSFIDFKKRKFDQTRDLWSFGVLIHDLLSDDRLFTASNNLELMHLVLYEPLKFSPKLPENFYPMVDGLLQKEPKQRISLAQVHAFLTAIENGEPSHTFDAPRTC